MLFWQVKAKSGHEYKVNMNNVTAIAMPDKNGEGAIVSLSDGQFIELAHNPQRAELIKDVIYQASAVERDQMKRIGKAMEVIQVTHSQEKDHPLRGMIHDLMRIADELDGTNRRRLKGRKRRERRLYGLGLRFDVNNLKTKIRWKARDFMWWVTH